MEEVRFIFWTAIKALSLVFLGLLAAKAVAGLAHVHFLRGDTAGARGECHARRAGVLPGTDVESLR